MKKPRVAGLDLFKILAYSISIGTILFVFFSNRSLFLDSLNLARNIAESSFSELSHPLKYEQSAPLLFLYISKLLTNILGVSEYHLRLFPLFSGIGCLLLFGKVMNRFLEYKYLIIDILWLGCHAMFIRYATEFKQYIVDGFVAIFLIWVVIKLEEKNHHNLIGLGIVGSLAIWLSMPSIFILLGILIYIFLNRHKASMSVFPVITLALWFIVNFVIEYYLILQPAMHSDHMQNFHQNYFVQGSFWKIESLQHDLGLMVSTIRMVVGKSGLAIGVALILISISIFNFIKYKDNKGILLVTPILAVFGASLVGKYSLIERLMLFTTPLILLLILIGLQVVIDHLKSKKTWIKYATLSIIGLALFIGFLQVQGFKYLIHPLEIEDNLTSLEFINKNQHRLNTVVCSQFAYPAYAYYTQYDYNYTYLDLGPAIATNYSDDLIELALNQCRLEKKEVWILFGHLQEAEISQFISEFDKVGTIKNSYRTNRSAAILFSTQ